MVRAASSSSSIRAAVIHLTTILLGFAASVRVCGVQIHLSSFSCEWIAIKEGDYGKTLKACAQDNQIQPPTKEVDLHRSVPLGSRGTDEKRLLVQKE